jgi:hypothetical protein
LIAQANSYVTAIDMMEQLWEQWTPSTKELKFTNPVTGEEGTLTGKNQIEDLKNQFKDSLANIISSGSAQARVNQMNIPQVYGSYLQPTSQEDMNKVIQRTQEVQKRRYAELSPEDYDALVKSFDKVAVLIEAGGQVLFKTFEGVDKAIMDEVRAAMIKAGEIADSMAGGGLPWSSTNATAAQLKQAESQAVGYTQLLESMGYQSEITDALYSTSDNQIVKTHGDQKVIQFLLQSILDTEKKQLEGMYNLPEGSTFWVPLTAAWLADRKGGGPDLSGLTGTPEDKNVAEQNQIVKPPASVTQSFQDRIAERKDKLVNELETRQYGLGQSELDAMKFRGKNAAPYEGKTGQDPVSLFEQMVTSLGESLQELGPLFESLASKIRGLFGGPDESKPKGPGLNSLVPENKMGQSSDTLINKLSNLGLEVGSEVRMALQQMLTEAFPNLNTKLPASGGLGSSLKDTQAPVATTKFDIRFTSTSQLVVDGRVLASIVKPSDLAKTNEAGGTLTKTYVI